MVTACGKKVFILLVILVALWDQQVFWMVWKSSPHVCHMKQHPDEYCALWRKFVDRLGLLKRPENGELETKS